MLDNDESCNPSPEVSPGLNFNWAASSSGLQHSESDVATFPDFRLLREKSTADTVNRQKRNLIRRRLNYGTFSFLRLLLLSMLDEDDSCTLAQ